MASDSIAEAIHRSRLVWTLNGDRLHLSHPVRHTRTLCGRIAEGPPAFPDAAMRAHQVCALCAAAYEREVRHA